MWEKTRPLIEELKVGRWRFEMILGVGQERNDIWVAPIERAEGSGQIKYVLW